MTEVLNWLHKLITGLGALATIIMMFKFAAFADPTLNSVNRVIEQNNTIIEIMGAI